MEVALQKVKDIETEIEAMLRRERTASFEERWNQLYDDLDNAQKNVKLVIRDDLETPHQCTAEIEAPPAGAELSELDAHSEDFRKMIEEMFAKLPTETRILEGVEIPTYDQLRSEAKNENELSPSEQNPSNGQCSGDVAS